jgi:3-methyladenine DNA glycosylase AlkD
VSSPRFGAAPEVAAIDAALAARGSEARAIGAKAYLKSDLSFHGVDAKGIRAVAREFLDSHPDLGHDQVMELVRGLWEVPNFEMRAVGVALLERRPDLLVAEDLELVEELLRRSETWALVDWLCHRAAALVLDLRPDAAEVLRRWSSDDDFWIRRSSMLTLLPGLRAGAGDWDLFASFASAMIEEKEFFIRKAIGWVLREVAKKRPELSYRFLSDHIDRVSGLTLREGAKYLPENQREELMDRYRSRSKRPSARPS